MSGYLLILFHATGNNGMQVNLNRVYFKCQNLAELSQLFPTFATVPVMGQFVQKLLAGHHHVMGQQTEGSQCVLPGPPLYCLPGPSILSGPNFTSLL